MATKSDFEKMHEYLDEQEMTEEQLNVLMDSDDVSPIQYVDPDRIIDDKFHFLDDDNLDELMSKAQKQSLDKKIREFDA